MALVGDLGAGRAPTVAGADRCRATRSPDRSIASDAAPWPRTAAATCPPCGAPHGQTVRLLLERAKELYPEARPRIISDNGPQFVAKDFKEFIRLSGMTHVRITPYYPQSNGKIERWHQTLKGDALRPAQPETLAQARQIVARFVEHYNRVRLHSALRYIAPLAFMAGQAPTIWAERDRKLEAAREQRRQRRQAERAA